MARQAGWLWGLIPLAVLWGAANLTQEEAVRRDVEQRASAAVAQAGTAPGARPISIRVGGRDVLVDGEALSEDGAARAMAELRSEFGVRRILGGLSQVVAQKPYSWAASREAGRIVLSGYAPDEATAKANLAAARALGDGLRVEDQQTIAFGAPEGFPGLALAMIADLGRLATGKVALDDNRFCVEGTASSPQDYLALRAAAAAPAPKGFSRVDCTLQPPLVAPYLWSAEKNAAGAVSVTGSYPTQEIGRQIAALLERTVGGKATISDRSLPGQGAPAGFLDKVTRALADLAELRSGKVALSGDDYTVSGEGPAGHEACEALRKRLPAASAGAIACPPPPPPAPVIAMPPIPDAPPLDLSVERPVAPAPQPPAPQTVPAPPAAPAPQRALSWRAERSDAGLVLSGLVPSAEARAALLAKAGKAMPGVPVIDRMEIAGALRPGPDFAAATAYALDLLARAGAGSVAIEGGALRIGATVAGREAWQAVTEALKGGALPAGLSLSGAPAIVLSPYDFSASVDRTGATLTGYLPDAGARAAIHALVEGSSLKERLRDETQIVPAAPAGFGVAARSVVQDLLRLDMGTGHVVDRHASVQGLTCRELIRSEVETSLAAGLPEGFTGTASVGLRQTGCVLDPPNTCQNDLDALTQRYYVMFGQGTAVVALDPITERAMTEATAILKQCPGVRVTVEGHANDDGERGGFNNLDLSRRRAQRVREELVRRGIEPEQLTVRGYGVDRPLVAHGSAEARVKNRRVQFTIAK